MKHWQTKLMAVHFKGWCWVVPNRKSNEAGEMLLGKSTEVSSE